MDFSTSVLGAYSVRKMQDTVKARVLVIGSDVYSRSVLAHVDCYHFTAAATLSAILNKEFKVRNTADLFNTIPPERLVLPRIGVVALAVLGAAFQARGIGGDSPLINWFKKHRNGHVLTFDSLKAREAAEHSAERKALSQRKTARRNKAHAIRVDRFEARQEHTNP